MLATALKYTPTLRRARPRLRRFSGANLNAIPQPWAATSRLARSPIDRASACASTIGARDLLRSPRPMFGLERGKGGSIAVWLILGILALAFGLTFGLPSDQLSFGENGLVKVHGQNVGNDDFVYQRQA